MVERHRTQVAVLASGGGTTAEAFIHATHDGRVNNAEVGLVICNNPPEKAGIWGRVARLNRQYKSDIEIVQINSVMYPGGAAERGITDEESEAITRKLCQRQIGLVTLLGYMKAVRGDVVDEFGWLTEYGEGDGIYRARMLNTHPGPLPETGDTYGIHTSQKVLDLGMAASRHTVHLVSAGIDQGPILAANPVEILEDDTAQDLFDRVQIVEKAALPYNIADFVRKTQHNCQR
jgi:folate-dependent phosphoribosylglycinamide formyltransferase PurN